MKSFYKIIAIATFLLAPSGAVDATGFDQKLLHFCSEVTEIEATHNVRKRSNNSDNQGKVGIALPIEGVPVEFGGESKGSINYSSEYASDMKKEYYEKDCDAALRAAARVSIADINANRDVALARLKMQKQTSMYKEDTKRHGISSDFNAKVIDSSTSLLQQTTAGNQAYLMQDRQLQSIELQDTRAARQRLLLDRENEMKARMRDNFLHK